MVFDEGEIRKVGLEVFNNLKQDFVIDTAEFELFDDHGVSLDKGLLTINGHEIMTLFHAVKKGKYLMVFRYTIGVEKLIDKISIQVI